MMRFGDFQLSSDWSLRHANFSAVSFYLTLQVAFATLKRQTEEKLKQIARTAEKIKNASQQKIRMVTCRAENAENELCTAKEKIFNMESELILLRDDSANLRYILRENSPSYGGNLIFLVRFVYD